jgi:ribonuclease HII
MLKIAGVDEAGRGCVIGPLVIAGVVFRIDEINKLKEMGVKDSKLLSPKKREGLSHRIRKIALEIEYFELKPREIDKVVFRGKPLRRLNYLETLSMAKVLRKLDADIAYVDPTDVDHGRCARQMKQVIPYPIEIFCEPKADGTYMSTGAASILAKVLRDKRINDLKEVHGDFGSGYPHDKKTIKFLEVYFEERREFPDFIRKSWSTVSRYREDFKQTRLSP